MNEQTTRTDTTPLLRSFVELKTEVKTLAEQAIKKEKSSKVLAPYIKTKSKHFG